MNPYAAPKARVELTDQVGGVWRQGELVRMDRSGALPDRCVVCNEAAGGHRLAQKLYCTPLAWKVGAIATPFGAVGIGIAAGAWWMVALFWPLVIILAIANVFVRKSVRIELGLCRRHRRIRTVLRLLSLACILGIVGAWPLMGETYDVAYPLLIASIAGVIVLAVVQAFTGIQRLKLKEVSDRHAWLARTGKPFRAALPELPA